MRTPRLLLTCLLLALACPSVRLLAEEPPAPTPAQALTAELEAAKASREGGAWTAALEKVGGVWADASEADRKPLASAVGHALKSKDEGVRLAGIQAFLDTKDGEAAWKSGLKAALPDAKTEAADVVEIRALESLRDLHPDGAVPPLLALAGKAKDPKVAAGAVKALGGYERSSKRVQILGELIDILRTTRPGRNPDTGQQGTSPRWDAMGPEGVPALNLLTGQKIGDLDQWIQTWNDHKKKPAALFDQPLE